MEHPGFDEYLAERNLRAARLLALLAAVLTPAGVVMDWFTHREHVALFFALRIGATVAAGLCFWLSYASFAKRITFWLGLAPILAVAVAIEAMIESSEGYASPYYVGLMHCLFALGVIFYWSVRQILTACTLVVAVWLVPTLFSGSSIEAGPFANNFYALVVAAAIAVASNANRFSAVQREHTARSEVVDALERLKELDHAKSRFFANVSHELRTPLTLIMAPLGELLDSPSIDAEGRSLIEVCQRNASRLLRHIDELLELSRLDAGRLRLNLVDIDLKALLIAQHENSRSAARLRKIHFELDAERNIEGIKGDAHRIDIILSNLVGNALKYTPEGGSITLRVRDAGSAAVVEVEDTGPGIPEEDLVHVFERFYQATKQERRRQDGVGIGLALSRELAELHGGSLDVQSHATGGTRFTLRLKKGEKHFRPDVVERRQAFKTQSGQYRRFEDASPLSTRSGVDSQPPPSGSVPVPGPHDVGPRSRVLVVEDQEDLRRFVCRLLERTYDVIEAKDGKDALDQVLEHRPDLVLSDIMMPNATGTELCRAIKSDPRLVTTPVILLTARVGSEATMDAYAHGADDFVAKPFHPAVLLARVRAQLRLRALTTRVVNQEKHSVVGVLAAGVAHEVRNPLNAIMSAATLLAERKVGEATHDKLLKVVAEGAQRINGIVGALDAHARPAEGDTLSPFDIRDGIEATLLLLEHRMAHVKVTRNYSSKSQVVVNVGRINQVLLNLIDNAARAGAQQLWITVREAERAVEVLVEDDGSGVPSDIANRIFDPFFTTREPGEGTGLGLHLAQCIVVEHGGTLRYSPRPGGGARFEFDLPAAGWALSSEDPAGSSMNSRQRLSRSTTP